MHNCWYELEVWRVVWLVKQYCNSPPYFRPLCLLLYACIVSYHYTISCVCTFISTARCCAGHVSCVKCCVKFGRSLSASGLALRAVAIKESVRSLSVQNTNPSLPNDYLIPKEFARLNTRWQVCTCPRFSISILISRDVTVQGLF